MRGLWETILSLLAVFGSGDGQYGEENAQTYNNGAASEVIWLNEGLQNDERWYSLTQGSRLLPLAWFEEMRDVKTGEVFGSRQNMERFGYPFLRVDDERPAGFVVEEAGDQAWLGLTCAACHTGEMRFEGKVAMVHGGSSMGDFEEFLLSVDASVEGLKGDDEARARIAKRMGMDDTKLLDEIDDWLDHRLAIDRVMDDASEWGPGRLDAVGMILRTTAHLVEREPAAEVPAANAPTNPPFLWNTNQQARLEYNGMAMNGPDLGIFAQTKIKAYFRNYGEVLGTFAHSEYSQDGMKTSIQPENLLALERELFDLQSPRWNEEIFGEIDQERAALGAEIYKNACASCHSVIAFDETEVEFEEWYPGLDEDVPFNFMQPIVDGSVTLDAMAAGREPNQELIGTDPMMACNVLQMQIAAGKLEGEKRLNSISMAALVDEFREEEPAAEILAAVILRDFGQMVQNGQFPKAYFEGEIAGAVQIMRNWYFGEGGGRTYSAGDDAELSVYEKALGECASYAQALHNDPEIEAPYPAYKARPLNGVWATAPYLHNGSVPSMDDLLKPQEERPAEFSFDGRDFDPIKLGLAYDEGEGNGFDYRVYDEEGEVILGNWNGGHEYGTDLAEDERAALIEYLKGL